MTIPAPVRFKRAVARGGGVEQVAKTLRCSVGFVSMLQNGKRTPGGPLAARIQREFKIPAALWFEAA